MILERIKKLLAKRPKQSYVIPNTPCGLAHFAFSSFTWVVTPDERCLVCEYDEYSRVHVVPAPRGFFIYFDNYNSTVGALDSLDDICELLSQFGEIRRFPRLIEFSHFRERGMNK